VNQCIGSPAGATARCTVLVAEDEPLIRMAFGEYLTDCGFIPLTVASGDEAIALLKQNIAVDLILSDVRMPGVHDGFALARWVAGHRPEIPLILVSGYSGRNGMPEDLSSIPMLQKPVEMRTLMKSIEHALQRQGAHAA
jgi:DNA-binding NtrC family response regulator